MNKDLVENLSLNELPQFDAGFFLQIIDSISDPVFVKDEQHRWVYLNQALCEFVGHAREDLLGKSDYAFFPQEEADVFWEKDDQVFASGESNVNIEKLTNAANRQVIISTRKSIITDSQGKRFLLGIIRDITQEQRREGHRERVAEVLKHLVLGASQEEILKIVLRVAEESLPGVIATILLLNSETQRLHSAIPSELPLEFTQKIDGTPARAGMGSCGEAAHWGERVIVEDIANHPNWQKIKTLALKHDLRACWSQPVFDFAGTVVGTFALYFPYKNLPDPFELEVLVTLAQLTAIALEHHRIEDEACQLRLLMTDTINAMPSLLITVDNLGRIMQWNLEAERMTGITESDAQGCQLEAVLNLTREQLQKLRLAIEESSTQKWPRIAHPWAGNNHWIDLTIYPLLQNQGAASVIRIEDITSQVQIEKMMVQAEKLHSLGGLTAGMAHEINNPLAGILQNVQIMKSRLQQGLKKNEEIATSCGVSIDLIEDYMRERKIHSLMDGVIEAGDRASNIVKNMLNFSHKEASEVRLNSLPALMDASIDLLGKDYSLTQGYDFRNIEIVRDYRPDLLQVHCEAGNMQQVFFNVLKNAAQAMADLDSPRICVRMREAGEWLRIEMEDNGPGMDTETRQHVFEPFYTTKPVGKGTGLGLSVSYFIITTVNQGRMAVDSQLERGTRFTIDLPLSGEGAD